jgi:predicted CoA-substrate-specific enzyme activase
MQRLVQKQNNENNQFELRIIDSPERRNGTMVQKMPDLKNSLGICVGASTVSAVKVALGAPPDTEHKPFHPEPLRVLAKVVSPHEGDPQHTLAETLKKIDMSGVTKVAATGRNFRHLLNLPTICEPEAVEHAFRRTKPSDIQCPAVICAGGETFMVYQLNPHGRITNVCTGNKCAAGTGEFFLQQLARLGTTLAEASRWTAQVPPYPVSGRCSVFCKSDCTHATNKGISKARVAAGLGQMMANKILELLKGIDCRNLMLTGGASQNQMMVRYLQEAIPGLIIPAEAPYFEALGAALWAYGQPDIHLPDMETLFIQQQQQFEKLPPLAQSMSRVEFKTIVRDTVTPEDICILGLDVGSTTTKAVLLRQPDNALLASVYLRTEGDPVGASRACYQAVTEQIEAQIGSARPRIIGLGVCGSGRHIAGLHAMTEGVINEITAHAAAALFFDPRVDTIFEIGGQDAKYTHISNKVPADYAMNEACSAGTGSFLEESAWETMAIPMTAIADQAMAAKTPPNFSDQCAAFIASDIKNAIHTGLARNDIVAGLVYSICMNYNNRVKGNRPVGSKIFMQGGVCYNHAVPLAMAALIEKQIVVPPEPGLMGAFGVALEIQKRIKDGLLAPGSFCMDELAQRTAEFGKTFICKGGKDQCDRRCNISRIRINSRTYPFGGACNRYENLRKGDRPGSFGMNLVRHRQELIFGKYAPQPADTGHPTFRGHVGINRSFLVNTYYPLYANFFSALGFNTVLPDKADQKGKDQRNAPFCFPAELAHGFFHRLITQPGTLNYIFLPHFKSLPTVNGEHTSQVCPLVQGEPFYLQAAFGDQLSHLKKQGVTVLNPLIDMNKGPAGAQKPLVAMARQMGISRMDAIEAFAYAKSKMEDCHAEMLEMGHKAIDKLEKQPETIGMVLFARPYSGYAAEAHMGIPDKFASRGILVLPLDFLDFAAQQSFPSMYWGMGQRIMMAARKIKSHPQLFGTYITNFSCGPDSFTINYFRNIMGNKPSLTLELDSHSADAGIETRIDAFLDIVQAHRKLQPAVTPISPQDRYQPASAVLDNGSVRIRTSHGRDLSLADPRVTLLFPSMGKIGTEALAAAFRSAGVKAAPLPPSTEAIWKIGRGYTSCKECLPLILTTGSLMHYIQTQKSDDEVVVYFMPNGSGPCRFGQYHVFMKDLIRKHKIQDVAVFSLSSDVGYDGLPRSIHRRGWWALVASDVFEDIRAMLLANAKNVDAALALFETQFQHTLCALETGHLKTLLKTLRQAALQLSGIGLLRPPQAVPRITLAGEIFVRRDGLSRQYITEYLAAKGFAAVCAPVAEWLLYSDYIIDQGITDIPRKGLKNRFKARIKSHVMRQDEQRIKKVLAASGLVHTAPIDIEAIVNAAGPHISPHLSGEAILTVGSSIRETASETCGAIVIGPFGCMPNRLSEAILVEVMKGGVEADKTPSTGRRQTETGDTHDVPFLAIESDGAPFPQQIHAKLEAFCLRAHRLHQYRHLKS